jgi:16S rRNA processing protein RimM
MHANLALVRLKGVSTPEQADSFRGAALRIAGRDAKPLHPGEYFLYQLIGLKVMTEEGDLLGTVTDLIETGANDVFVVTPPEGGTPELIPNIADVVLDIDPQGGTMTVRPLEYLDS